MRFQVNGSYILYIKEIQFCVLLTTLLIFSAALEWTARRLTANQKVADPCPRHRETFNSNYQTIATFIILFEEPKGSYVNPKAEDERVTTIVTSTYRFVLKEHRIYGRNWFTRR
jgi:hypothetical protein